MIYGLQIQYRGGGRKGGKEEKGRGKRGNSRKGLLVLCLGPDLGYMEGEGVRKQFFTDRRKIWEKNEFLSFDLNFKCTSILHGHMLAPFILEVKQYFLGRTVKILVQL